MQAWDVATKDDGSGTLKMTVPDAGQFRISVKIADSEGHEMEGGYVLFVRGPAENGSGYRFNDLELITEKQEYQPGEKVQLQINTNKAGQHGAAVCASDEWAVLQTNRAAHEGQEHRA